MAETPKSPFNDKPINRAEQVDSNIQGEVDKKLDMLSVDLEAMDGAIMWYMNNVIRPQVTENGQVIPVPVLYGSQERWKSVQKDGYFRDNKGRITTPLIMFKRSSVARDEAIPIDKLDANNPELFYTVERKYTQKNRFDLFNILTNQQPVREFYHVIIPDYVVATYEVILWTQYQTQMNDVVESMVYASDAYWGERGKFRFRSRVGDISTPIEITNDADRTLRSTFNITVNGYLSANTVNKILSNQGSPIKKTLSVKKTVVFNEVDNFPKGIFDGTSHIPLNSNVQFPIVGVGGGTSAPQAITQMLQYLNKQFVKEATSVTINTATFNATIASPPTIYPYTQTVQENFIFFCNGAYVENSAIVSFVQSGTDAILTIDPNLLGYEFDGDDEIIAVGKFDA